MTCTGFRRTDRRIRGDLCHSSDTNGAITSRIENVTITTVSDVDLETGPAVSSGGTPGSLPTWPSAAVGTACPHLEQK
jgi:hypothetical protein